MLRLLILIMLFILTVSFASCGKESSGDEENGCAHEYSVRITKEPTCDNAGVIIYTCSLCRDTLSDSIPALGHSEVPHEGKAASCSERGWEPYVTCNHEGCGYTTYKAIQFLECIPENGRCKLCGISCTAGLMFSYNHKNNSYTLTGIGSATDEDIYIPRIYCGLPVMEIADYAFRSCKTAKA